MFPRDYQTFLSDGLGTEADVITAAVQIRFADGIDENTKLEELRALLSETRANEIDITESEVVEAVEERERDELTEPAQYSWVHMSLFRLYELHDRCFSWQTESELREQTTNVPGPAHPAWEDSFNSD